MALRRMCSLLFPRFHPVLLLDAAMYASSVVAFLGYSLVIGFGLGFTDLPVARGGFLVTLLALGSIVLAWGIKCVWWLSLYWRRKRVLRC